MAHVKNWSPCRFPEADLSFACFGTCDMHGVDLSRASLFGAMLGANFQEAKLDNAKLFPRLGSDSAGGPLNHTELCRICRACAYALALTFPATEYSDPQTKIKFISCSGTMLISCSAWDRAIEVRKLPGGECLMIGLNAACTCAAVSPDDQFLACVDMERKEIHIYELASGARIM